MSFFNKKPKLQIDRWTELQENIDFSKSFAICYNITLEVDDLELFLNHGWNLISGDYYNKVYYFRKEEKKQWIYQIFR